jgi:hypothetical protein
MPYIKPERKSELVNEQANYSGELNYKITELAIEYLDHKGKSYDTINEIMGAMECAKLEFYRRVAVPYEETKKEENGDVYG